MTITAHHPSGLTFTCPPWCNRTHADHLSGLSELGGRVMHASADREGDAGWVVSLSSMSYPDGSPAGEGETLVNVCVSDCDMSAAQLDEFRQVLTAAGLEALR